MSGHVGGTTEVRVLGEEEFLGAGAAWDGLLAGSAADSFFLRHLWLATWWRHFGRDKELLALEVREGGTPVGLAPLCIARETAHRVLRIREVSFLGREKVTGDYLDLIPEPGRETEVIGAVLKWLLDHDDRWDVLRIADVVDGSPTLRILANAAASFGLDLAPAPGQVCPYRPLPETWDAFLAGSSANLRSNLRRREKKLRAAGAEFVENRGAAVLPALDALFELHAARWSSRGKSGNFGDPRMRAFHRDIAVALDREDRLGLWTVEAEGRAVAAIYGFMHRDRFHYYQAGFDPAWSEQGVGLAVMGFAMRRCIERGLAEFDFLRGEEDYKRRWTDRERRTHAVMVLPPTMRARAWRALDGARGTAKRLLQRMPAEAAPPAVGG